MAKLEEITVGSTIKGIAGDEPVSIVAIQWYGSSVIEITYGVTAPKGIPSSTVRTVSENCRTLMRCITWCCEHPEKQR